MKTRAALPFAPALLFLALMLAGSAAWAEPVVSNLTASQRAGTQLADIVSDVATPGFSAWTVPTPSATKHVGLGVAPGTGRDIVWNARANWAETYRTPMRFRVVADDLVPAGFAHIPGGSFTMGRTSGDTDSNAPPVTVTVSSFYLAETETTKAQWDTVRAWALAHSSPYTDLAAGAGKAGNHPVQTVSWWDVVKWCNARSEMEGLTPVYTVGGVPMRTGATVPDVNWAANGYRLPTEAEWEKAARGGVSGQRFPWGTDTISHAEANYYASGTDYGNLSGNVGFHPTYNDGNFPYTSPVGSFPGNGFGLKDMAGNVWEWCWDWYAAGTYVGGATDPRGPASGANRVARGGGWLLKAIASRASIRISYTPANSNISFGFRTARSSVP